MNTDADLGFMRWLTVNFPGQPEHQLLLEKPGPPAHDEATAEQIRELVTKGAMGMAAIIAVDDVHKTYEELVAKGVEFTEEPTERFYGTDCGLRDPFGNHLRIGTPKEGPIEMPDPAEFAAENGPRNRNRVGLVREPSADRQHLSDPRWSHAGTRRARGGPGGRLRPRWLVGELLGRADAGDDGRRDVEGLRPPARPQDLRDLRRPLALQRRPGRRLFNNATKHVASRTLETLEWSNSQLLEDEVAVAVPRLKEQDGPELQVHGSADLIQTLIALDLVDEFRLWIFPVVVGPGKRLFGDRTQAGALELVDSKTSSTGVVIATYRRAGEIETGSFALEQPTEARP